MSAVNPPRLEALLADPLCEARAVARGKPVIGYLGNDVPVALILAAGAHPVRLRGLAGLPTPHADQFLESAFTPEVRAIAEQWLTGTLDFLSAVVFPRSDDAAQRLYYYVCELQRRGICAGPRALLFDVANIGRAASADYTRESVRRLAGELGAAESGLALAVNRVRERDALLADIRDRRRAAEPLAGSIGWRLERASASDWSESFDELAREVLASAPPCSPRGRLLLAGDALPDDALHRAVEAEGGSIVSEFVESDHAMSGELPRDFAALADLHHARRNPVMAMRERADRVAAIAREARASGVLFWLIEEDEALPWEIARQARSLQAANIPALLLARQSWIATADSLRQVREFLRSLEVR